MSDYSVRCQALTKNFGQVGAVTALDLEVQRGEILALVGPSGCGKTTTLRLIAGFERLDAGVIEIENQIVSSPSQMTPPEKRRVGMVFQQYALFPHLSVTQNIAYGLNGSADRVARVREVLQLVGMADLDARMPHELSGGQQQRVALARALAPRPNVLLLDEPFSGLDAGLREQVRAEVAQILRASGATVIFVTHNQEEALFMGDRIAVMNAGAVEQIGAPEQVFGSPATRFVAAFMGETDFLNGIVCDAHIETEIGNLAQAVDLPKGTPVEIALRPDDVQIFPDPHGSAQVMERQYKGVLNLYGVRLPSGQIVHSYAEHTLQIARGARVRVAVNPGHALACFAREEIRRFAQGVL